MVRVRYLDADLIRTVEDAVAVLAGLHLSITVGTDEERVLNPYLGTVKELVEPNIQGGIRVDD